jgi:hypothetical protein
MVNQTAYIFQVLVYSLVLTAFASPVVAESANSSREGNAFTWALLPGFERPSAQYWGMSIAGSRHRADPRFLMKPVHEHADGRDSVTEPVLVDNLLRYRF